MTNNATSSTIARSKMLTYTVRLTDKELALQTATERSKDISMTYLCIKIRMPICRLRNNMLKTNWQHSENEIGKMWQKLRDSMWATMESSPSKEN